MRKLTSKAKQKPELLEREQVRQWQCLLRHAILLILGSLLLVAAPTARVSTLDVVAIRNARIVTGMGRTIARGTVVFRNGVITDIGESVNVPADARVIEEEGLTVYPGLIDGYTHLGLPSSSQNKPSPPGMTGEPAAGSLQEFGYQVRGKPSNRVADLLQPDATGIESARSYGVTVALASPRTGIFAGQSAVINLATDKENVVIRTPAALTVQFSRTGGLVTPEPNSLMGSVAYIRQMLYDAIHYGDETNRNNRMAREVTAPKYDKELAALQSAVRGDLPTMFVANTEADIRRALSIADEFRLKLILVGASQAYRLAGDLKSKSVPVILSVDYPRRVADLPNDVDEPLRVLRERAETPRGAAILAKAGVKFAFMSGTLSPTDFFANIQKAVESGLSKDDALRALTTNPAEMLGVGKELGTIEVGKTANLVITRGDLFARGTTIQYVFIDGRSVDVKKPAVASSSLVGMKPPVSAEITSAAGVQTVRTPLSEDDSQSKMTQRDILIRNATLLTASHGRIMNSSILIRAGRIAEIGRDITTGGENAQIIEATGKYVIPGIIDCHSHTAIEGGINEASARISPAARIRDVFNPNDVNNYRELAGGVTTLHVLHGSLNTIGGQTAVLKLKVGRPLDEWFISDAPMGIKFALGENAKRSFFQVPGIPRRYPATRMGVAAGIRDAFTKARDYMAKWQEYEAEKRRDQGRIPPRRDLALDALVEVLQGKRFVHAHCYRADEILMLLDLAKELGFQVRTLQHVLEGYKIADEIKASKTAASTFADHWSFKMEAFEATPYNSALMSSRGVLVSVNSDSNERAKVLYLEAAKAIKYGGVSEEEALRMITLNPAIQLGIDKRTGSIDVGKDADLVIFSGNPFSVYSIPEMTIVEGQVYFDRSEDLKNRSAIKSQKHAPSAQERKNSERQ